MDASHISFCESLSLRDFFFFYDCSRPTLLAGSYNTFFFPYGKSIYSFDFQPRILT